MLDSLQDSKLYIDRIMKNQKEILKRLSRMDIKPHSSYRGLSVVINIFLSVRFH